MMLIKYISASILFLTAGYLILRVNFRFDYRQLGHLSIFSTVAGTILFFIWGAFPYIYGPKDWPDVHLPLLLEMLGWSGLVGGLVILFAGMAFLGIYRSLGRGQSGLICSGFYAYSRNPQVVGCALYGMGFAILWPSGYAAGWVILLLVILHIMVITEEEHLHNIYGEDYESYSRRVPRYISFRLFRGSISMI